MSQSTLGWPIPHQQLTYTLTVYHRPFGINPHWTLISKKKKRKKGKMPTQTLAPIAQSAFSQASAYDRNRPVYTSTEADSLLTLVGLNGRKGARVVDLGAGTGLFTAALSERAEEFDIIAVDPHDDMRGELERKALRGVTVKKGWGSEIAVEDGSVDAVFAAQVIILFTLFNIW